MPIINLPPNFLNLNRVIKKVLKRVAARYGDTPSGFSGDVVKATKEILNGERSQYSASIPSQRTYIFGEKNFPASTHEAVFDPSLAQYDVNFGIDTFYVPKQDSVIFMQNLNNRAVKGQQDGIVQFPNGLVNFNYTANPNAAYFYDAGKHSITPKIDENGNPVVQLDDVYDFTGSPDKYIQKYTTADPNQSPDWLRKLAVRGMQYIGTPYEVHQTVPVKFTGNTGQTSEATDDRTMVSNILRAFNRQFKKPVDNMTDEEVSSLLTNRNVPGDELIKEWESKGLLQKHGGTLNYFDYFK